MPQLLSTFGARAATSAIARKQRRSTGSYATTSRRSMRRWRRGFEGAALPPFVRRELEGYLDCGLLCRGFARLKCESCAEQHLVGLCL